MPMTRTREQHIEWTKQRALEYVDIGDVGQAFASYISDMGKHPEADPDCMIRRLAGSLRIGGHLSTAKQMRDFINGTN